MYYLWSAQKHVLMDRYLMLNKWGFENVLSNFRDFKTIYLSMHRIIKEVSVSLLIQNKHIYCRSSNM